MFVIVYYNFSSHKIISLFFLEISYSNICALQDKPIHVYITKIYKTSSNVLREFYQNCEKNKKSDQLFELLLLNLHWYWKLSYQSRLEDLNDKERLTSRRELTKTYRLFKSSAYKSTRKSNRR